MINNKNVNLILDFCQESPIKNMSNSSIMQQSYMIATARNPISNAKNDENLIFAKNLKEITNESIREEESHCLKKLTRVLT